ncbi:hypothetical protein EDD53_1823 [Pacificibacter maritimus]|uniref:Uncharacterized protein n=1 Tax=Pacificibacter maritimus TaxID=762213 RepID=A0A3N4V395_9RHOB|nr:DUF6634 family protein [Pacificibacter maritimus]RPE67414.1 hypothetical protein EDD53_1823 [Pacificibacter maritimus]
MDPNDDDIALLQRLAEVADTDSHSWRNFGEVAKDDISEALMAELVGLAPFMKLQPDSDGRFCMSAAEWMKVYHAAKTAIFERMRHRSFELALSGPGDLSNAPTLKLWLPVRSSVGHGVALVGLVSGHPFVGDGWIRTSPLCGLDGNGDWARSTSRWYGLMEPSTPEVLRKATGLKPDAIARAALSLPEALARLAEAQNEEGFLAT